MERVSNFRFLGIQIEEDLSWSANTSMTIKKGQQRLYFLRLIGKNHLSQKCLCHSIAAHRECADKLHVCAVLQVHSSREKALTTTTKKITGCSLPSLDYSVRCL